MMIANDPARKEIKQFNALFNFKVDFKKPPP